jgi:hypothetical protein
MVRNKVDELQSKQAEILNILQNISYDKVDSYIDSHVVDLPSAKTFLKKLSKLVLYVVKEN